MNPHRTPRPPSRAGAPRRLGAWALVGLLSAGLGCAQESAPVTAAKRYAQAIQVGEPQALIPLLDESTRQVLANAAERATDQIGGRRQIEPEEMLQVVDVDPRFQVRRAELVEREGDRAVVELLGVDGTTHTLHLVLQGGEWRVTLPTQR